MGALQSTNYDCHEFLPSRDSSVHSSFETLDDLDEEEGEQGQGRERIINSVSLFTCISGFPLSNYTNN